MIGTYRKYHHKTIYDWGVYMEIEPTEVENVFNYETCNEILIVSSSNRWTKYNDTRGNCDNYEVTIITEKDLKSLKVEAL